MAGPDPTARTLRRWSGGILLAAILAPFLWVWWVWPPPVWYRWFWPRETSFMAIRRAEAREAGASTDRHYVPVSLETVPTLLKEAVLAGEDQRFREHDGIDYVELRKALGYRRERFSWLRAEDRAELRRALRRAWERHEGLRGASTITQQLAKNLYLSPARSPLRKLKEAITAWRLEYWLGKDRILELYLNTAEFGPGIWGVEAASQAYFKKSATRLSLEEAAGLAATLPFPLRSNPASRPGRMRWRQGLILRWLRGERVEIPPVPELPPDSMQAVPDTLILPDSLVRRDTTRPDTVRIRPDTGTTRSAPSPPAAGASRG